MRILLCFLQIVEMKDEYESTNYRDHFHASQKLVKQLQTELDQYTQLIDDLEHTQILQVGQSACSNQCDCQCSCTKLWDLKIRGEE